MGKDVISFDYEKHTWLLFALFVVVIIISLLIQFEQLPGPLFGGDLYYQMGHINHLLHGGNLFEGSNIAGLPPGYFYTYAWVVSLFGFILGLSAFNAMMLIMIPLIVASIFLWYKILNKLYGSSIVSLITLIIVFPISSFLIMKYSHFSLMIMFPLLIFLLMLDKDSWKYWISIGLVIGLFILAHGVGIVMAYLLFGFFWLFRFYPFYKKKKFKTKKFKMFFLKTVIAALIGFVIGLIYWAQPISLGFQTPEPYLEWNDYDFSQSSTRNFFAMNSIKGLFFNFSSLMSGLTTTLVLFGLFLLFALKSNEKKQKIMWLTILGLVMMFHHLLTEPLTTFSVYPKRLVQYSGLLLKVLLVGLSVSSISKWFSSIKISHKKYYVGALVLLIVILQVLAFNTYTSENRWVNQGKNSLSDNYQELSAYLINHDAPNKVLLSNNELGFAVNGLSGIKLVSSRRAQNYPFINMSERMLDAAIILYGNSSEKRKELLEKYDVDYFYWDQLWFTLDWQFDNSGNLVGYSDPFLVFDTPEYRAELEKYNVSYSAINGFVDPSHRSEYYQKMDILLIMPNQFLPTRPWIDDFDNFLEEELVLKNGDSIQGILYKIKSD